MTTEDVKKNTKTSLREKKKDELINIILRKDDVEIKLKSELEHAIAQKDATISELSSLKKDYCNLKDECKNLNESIDINKKNIYTLTDELKASNTKISNLTKEKDRLQSKINTMNVELENRNTVISDLKTANKNKIIVSLIIAIIAIIGWII